MKFFIQLSIRSYATGTSKEPRRRVYDRSPVPTGAFGLIESWSKIFIRLTKVVTSRVPAAETVIAYAPVDEGLRRGEPTMTCNYFR